MQPRLDVALAPRTTIRVGGPARFFVEVTSLADLVTALGWANRDKVPVRILGGGSNVLVADSGWPGLVIGMGLLGIDYQSKGDRIRLTAAAGEPWDHLVELAVHKGWSGFECLSGIPGSVGATPIQNVGAYGQEVADTIQEVVAVDDVTGQRQSFTAAECEFGYRRSRFKHGALARLVVVEVAFELRTTPPVVPEHAEIKRRLREAGNGTPSAAELRAVVMGLRRERSMLFEPTDPFSRSCGSFFVNPIVPAAQVERLTRATGGQVPPTWSLPGGLVKVAAAWLIEKAGFAKGYRLGLASLSIHHCLAIVAHNEARAADVVGLARRIRDEVRRRFEVDLVPEPAFWGFNGDPTQPASTG